MHLILICIASVYVWYILQYVQLLPNSNKVTSSYMHIIIFVVVEVTQEQKR